jgi:hypothetical protein
VEKWCQWSRKERTCPVKLTSLMIITRSVLPCYAILFCVKIGQKEYPRFGQLHCK